MKNRFVIFAGDNYYPPRNGIVSGHETFEEAKLKISIKNKYEDEKGWASADNIFVEGDEYPKDWAYIVDMETLEEVFSIDI